jgi:hypothetical protein
MTTPRRDPIPSTPRVDRELEYHREKARLLERQRRVSQDADAAAERARQHSVSRYRKESEK